THARAGDSAIHRMTAVQPAATDVNPALNVRRVAQTRALRHVFAGVDYVAIRKADRDMEAAGAEFLEVRRFLRLDERLMGRGAVQGIGLQPLLAAGDAVRGRARDHFVQARIEVGDDCLTLQRRLGDAVCLEVRAGRNHPYHGRFTVPRGLRGNRAGILTGKWVDGTRQCVAHRLVEHVVGDLAGGIAKTSSLVEQLEVEAAEARLIGPKAGDAYRWTTGVLLTVQRVIVREHEHCDLGGRERSFLQRDPDRGLARSD